MNTRDLLALIEAGLCDLLPDDGSNSINERADDVLDVTVGDELFEVRITKIDHRKQGPGLAVRRAMHMARRPEDQFVPKQTTMRCAMGHAQGEDGGHCRHCGRQMA